MTIALVKVSCINDRLIPLGLACLQAFLKQDSIPVKVFNFRTTNYTLPKVVFDPLIQLNLTDFIVNHQDLPLLLPIVNDILNNRGIKLSDGLYPDILNDYSSRMFENPETTKKRFESMIDYSKNTVLEGLKEFETLGFSLNYLNISETVISSCYLKLHNPECKIIWGGPTITQSFDAFKIFLYKGICDGLVIGEGERPLLDFARGIDLKGIKGVMSINESGLIQFTKGEQINLDLLPTPDYTDIPLDTYYQIASTYRSRGCTNRCKFCAEWSLFGPRFRTRSIENVILDVEEIVQKYKPRFMLFGESLINDDLDYFEKLCDALIEKKINIKFGTHFRANITPELAKKAKLAGFEDAWVGFEAFSDIELKEMNKGTSVNQNLKTIENLTRAGINVIAMLVVGFSGLETETNNCKSIVNTIEHFSFEKSLDKSDKGKSLPIQWRPAPMYIVPGSFDYSEKMEDHTWPWKCKFRSKMNEQELAKLELALNVVPYTFKRPIPDAIIVNFLKQIQEADRKAGFSIGGVMKYVIDYTMEEKRKNRQKRKTERIGVSAQRFEATIKQTTN
ncbi:MAG: radical SAM protein [Candidatus Lokiarchaeota archaeon]|nr:radical SAM protein [Candidatus Lokiarchaeota archaeon]